MDHVLHQPLGELRERVGRLEGCRSRRGRRAGSTRRSRAATRVVRGTRQAASTTTNATRKQDREHVRERHGPATFQCTFSNVTQKTRRQEEEARDAPHATCAPAAARAPATRVRRETFSRHSSESARRLRAPRRASGRAASRSARAIPSTSSGATTTPAPASRISSAAAPSGGTTARIGRSAARYSNTFPESTPLPAAAGLRDQQQQRLRVALELERAAARRVRDQLEPVAEAERLGPLAVGRAEVAEEARDDVVEAELQRGQERPRVALAEERAGVRDPEAARPACTRARRSRRSRSRSRSSRPAPGSSARISSAIASETATIASACRATSCATACSPCSLARTSSRSAWRCGCATSESRRSATHGRPSRA